MNTEPGLSLIAALGLLAMLAVLMWALVCVLIEPVEHEPQSTVPVEPEPWLEGEEFFDFPRPTKNAGASPERPPARDTEGPRA